MQVTHKINIHLDDQRRMPPIDVMQGDAYTRSLEFTLYSGGEKWDVPEGVSVAVAYYGASGHGAYDTLPDDSKAYIVDGSTVTVTLIPQVTAVHGKTTISVVFTDDTGKQLATFGVELRVAPNPAVGAGEPANYYNLREWASTPFRIDVIHTAESDLVTNDRFDTIRQEYEAGRQMVCCVETEDQQSLDLPLVEAKGHPYVFRFSAVSGGTEWTTEISQGADGAAVAKVSRTSYVPAPAATDEKFFDITADGIISLKPEYRGASPSTSAAMVNSVSDNGVGREGSQNCGLPEEIIVPASIGGVAVTGYAAGMFYRNTRLQKITLLPNVAAIPTGFCSSCYNLKEIAGTEAVQSLGQQAFAYTAITEARFPNLTELAASGSQFTGCARLLVADLGGTITGIPAKCFSNCEKLARLEGCESVTTLGAMALYFTKCLKELPFRANLTSTGNNALFLSRANTEGFIPDPGGNYKPCHTRMYSVFEQHDPRWAWKWILRYQENGGGYTGSRYTEGCGYVCAAMVYSALEAQELDTPEAFIQELFHYNPDLAKEDQSWDETLVALEHLAEGMAKTWGYTWTLHRRVDATSVQALYDALAASTKDNPVVAMARIVADHGYGNHTVVIYGVNADGEVMMVDPANTARLIGIYEAPTYSMPIQNLCRATDYLLIMRKE